MLEMAIADFYTVNEADLVQVKVMGMITTILVKVRSVVVQHTSTKKLSGHLLPQSLMLSMTDSTE